MLPIAISCTGSSSPPAATLEPTSGAGPLPSVRIGDVTYEVTCTPVAEALVDIELPHESWAPKTRAITGVWNAQAVAVLAGDPKGCGVWTLGIADGLTAGTAEQIRTEVAEGVERFGVTESPVPREAEALG